ncbi:MAG: Sapep family Mn(2+)-dependent dipeptidase [Spirochaetota bacterium]|nr:Sapep family Mn(2+)-dependent dipeptidase [Spirochaetota bacterium]
MNIREDLIKEYKILKSHIIQTVKESVAYPSILNESEDNTNTSHPFGIEIEKCLDHMLGTCKQLGFKTFKDPKGYYGYAEIGEGKELMGILGHLDVVPVDDIEKWDSDPFTLVEKDGDLIARGTSDDKGPTIVALYAAKALMNLGYTFNKRIRFIFGTDEESLWRCITRYCEIEEIPSIGFTPDSKFPVIYAEKGLWQVVLTGKGEDININGGGAFNSVPNSIEYKDIKQEELIASLKRNNFEYELIDKGIKILGKTAHAQDTEKGINPIQRLLFCLKEIGMSTPTIEFITSKFALSPFAEPIFGVLKDEVSGELKCNLARIEVDKNQSKLYFDLRIPVTFEMNEIISKFNEVANNNGFESIQHDRLNSLYVSKDDYLVKTLCEIYGEETNFDTTPLAMGGATYSRAMKNFVTYGMVFPDSPKTAHLANEHITIKDIDRAFIIYGRAIHKLSQ